MFDIICLGTFDSWVIASYLKKIRRWYDVKERFFNFFFNYHYPFINRITIYNSKIKKSPNSAMN